MIQAGIKRQLKFQNAQARTKRKSTSTQPLNRIDHQQDPNISHQLMTQDFRANSQPVHLHPDVYYKTHLPPSQEQKPLSKTADQNRLHPINQRFDSQCPIQVIGNGLDELNQSFLPKRPAPSRPTALHIPFPTAQVAAGVKDDTDPSQMMESLVDPHLSPPQLQRFDEADSYEHLGLENENDSRTPYTEQRVHIKPLVYDPQKNPYPPPEQLPENMRRPVQDFRLQSSSSPFLPQGPSAQIRPHHSISNSPDWGKAVQAQPSPSNFAPPTALPFPSPRISSQTQPVPVGSYVRRSPIPATSNTLQQSTSMQPGSSSSQRIPYLDSVTNFGSVTSSQFIPSQFTDLQRPSETNPRRRPSKLVKLRRRGSSSSNNSSLGQRSNGSFRQFRDFVDSLQRRVSQGSQSANESDSSVRGDHAPNTPSSLEPAGGMSSGVESEANERLRPMQAQFYRLFRKHNHPEHLRRQNRSMLVQKKSSPSQELDKGKTPETNVIQPTVTSTDDEFYHERCDTRASSRLSMNRARHATSTMGMMQPRDSDNLKSEPVTTPGDSKKKNSMRRSRWRL